MKVGLNYFIQNKLSFNCIIQNRTQSDHSFLLYFLLLLQTKEGKRANLLHIYSQYPIMCRLTLDVSHKYPTVLQRKAKWDAFSLRHRAGNFLLDQLLQSNFYPCQMRFTSLGHYTLVIHFPSFTPCLIQGFSRIHLHCTFLDHLLSCL